MGRRAAVSGRGQDQLWGIIDGLVGLPEDIGRAGVLTPIHSVDKPVARPTDQSSRSSLNQDAMNERNSFDYDRPLSIAVSFHVFVALAERVITTGVLLTVHAGDQPITGTASHVSLQRLDYRGFGQLDRFNHQRTFTVVDILIPDSPSVRRRFRNRSRSGPACPVPGRSASCPWRTGPARRPRGSLADLASAVEDEHRLVGHGFRDER